MSFEKKREKRPYLKPTVQSEQAPEKQIMATDTCRWKAKSEPVQPCTKMHV